MKKKILLTGASGFIGFNLLERLLDDNNVIIILRKKNNKINQLKKKKKLKIIYYKKIDNLHNLLKKIKADIVINCATYYVKNHNYKDIIKMNYSNILFGNLILDNIKFIKFKKFINFTTVWENYNGIKNNPKNLYSAYKQSFSNILNFYKIKYPRIKFYNIFLSETFGENDNRMKLIPVLKKNFRNSRVTKIVSKNLIFNILNVHDIIKAIEILLNKKVKKGDYVIKNSLNFRISNIIKNINNQNIRKLKINYLSNKIIKEKLYNFKPLPFFKPKNSKLIDVVRFIND